MKAFVPLMIIMVKDSYLCIALAKCGGHSDLITHVRRETSSSLKRFGQIEANLVAYSKILAENMNRDFANFIVY